jgi:signal transduction histidine kinase/GAF domain-containing protein
MDTRIHSSALEESEIIERVARIVSSLRATKPDYTQLAAELEPAIPFDIFGVVLLRHDQKAVRITVCQREEDEWRSSHHQLPVENSMFYQVIQAPLLTVRDYPSGLEGDPASCGDALSGHPQLRSTLITPLVVGDRTLGTLELGSAVPQIYRDPHLQRLIKAVVQVLANAIDSAVMGGKAEIQDRQSKELQKVSTALASKTELAAILDQIVVGIAQSLNVASAMSVASAIFMRDRHENKLCLQAQSGLDLEKLHKICGPCLPISEGCIISQTLLQRRSIVSSDIATDAQYPESSAFFTELGMHSVLSYPLVTGTTVYGALLLLSPEHGGFTPLKAEILSLFASQATVAIHNGMLLEAAQQRSRLQEAIEQLEDEERARSAEDQMQHDLALLEYVRKETRRIFGVSFTTLLRYVCDNLPTQNERALQAGLSRHSSRPLFSPAQAGLADPEQTGRINLFPISTATLPEPQDPLANNVVLLARTAEAALEGAGSAGELSRLLLQFKQSTTLVGNAWFVVDPNGFCTYMNPAAETLCGVRLGAMTPYSTQLLIPEQKDAPSLPIEHVFEKLLPRIRNVREVLLYLQDFSRVNRRELRCVLAAEPVHSSPISLHTPPAEHHSLLVEGAPSDHHYRLMRYPLYNTQGKLVMHALQVHDVTEQVRDEKNQSALLSAVSHDLRTPLTTIKGAVTGLLQPDVCWSEQDRMAMLEDINSETDHLTVLVNALVEMSRISMGALVLEKEWCDACEIAYGALAKLGRSATGCRIQIAAQPSPLPLVYVDHAQLERVFYNLIENAIRHAPEQMDIQVLLDILHDEKEMLRVQVIDHGPGIPASERQRIFRSFYSLRSYGNGLGLAICKGIIDAHQGRIYMDVVASGGACVVFTVPLRLPTTSREGSDLPKWEIDAQAAPVIDEVRP